MQKASCRQRQRRTWASASEKVGSAFWYPRRPADGDLPSGLPLHEERHQGEERQTQGRRARDGQIVPLALTLHAEMRAGFLEGDFHRPPAHEGTDDLAGW